MKEKYLKPQTELNVFHLEDVITTSGGTGGDDGKRDPIDCRIFKDKTTAAFCKKKQTSVRMSVFCFFICSFIFAGSGMVVLLQATHNTLPARSKALHIGRRQPKALCACRFPPALRDQTRRWYRKRRSWTADAKCKWPFCFAQRN